LFKNTLMNRLTESAQERERINRLTMLLPFSRIIVGLEMRRRGLERLIRRMRQIHFGH